MDQEKKASTSADVSTGSGVLTCDDGAGPRLCTASELRRLVADGSLSASDVASATLERLRALNPRINAVVTVSDQVESDAAELDARRARGEALGALHGVPVVIKDVTETAGLRTTYGSPVFKDFVPQDDALVVEGLKAAGALVIGKSNTPEMALGGHTTNEVFGPTRNPWDLELSPGGSTGGGAAALVAGMAALAEGTDLGGSLRIPAAFCGLVGLRPSPGLVPTWPTADPWDTLYVTGPMARSAEDVALFLDATGGQDPRVPLRSPGGEGSYVDALRRATAAGLRVAYAADPTGIGIDPELQEVCRQAAEFLREAAVQVEEIELDVQWARETFRILRGAWALARHQHRLGDAEGEAEPMGPNLKANLELGLSLTSREVGAATQARGRLFGTFLDLFARFDAVLTPTMAVKPFRVVDGHPTRVAGRPMQTYIDWLAPTSVLSLTSLPVLSVPAGLDRDGLPVGLQIVTRPRDEITALVLGKTVQSLRPVPLPWVVL